MSTPDTKPEEPITGSKSDPTSPSLGWVDNNQSLAIGLGFVLIALYVAPIFLIGLAAWNTHGFQEDSFLFSWFAAFMKSADSTLNQFHKILLPIMTAISVIAFRGRPTKAMLLLFSFILFSFVTTVFVDVVFDMNSTLAAIKGLDSPIDARLVKSFFVRVEESLMMYLMMLIGINIVNAKK
jgi:hypothetical protein